MRPTPLVNLDLLNTEPQTQQTGGDDHTGHAFGAITIPLCNDTPAAILDAAADGKDVHYISAGSWSMHDLLTEALERTGPAVLYFSTYSITEFSARVLVQHLDAGQLQEVHMLIDDRARVRYPEVYQLASNIANRIRLVKVHAKVMVLRGKDRSYTIVNSANWTKNPRIEAGVVSCSPQLAIFHTTWLNKALQHGTPFG